MQKVNILGTEYEIIREAFEEETIDGFCDYTAHIIKVRNNNVNEVGDFEKLMKKQLRHEIIHAFLYGDGFRFCRRTERDSKANQEACGNVKTWVRSTIYINVTIYTVNHIGHFLFLLDTPPFIKA